MDIAVSGQAERYTMALRNLLFAVIGLGVRHTSGHGVDLGRRRLCAQGWVTLGQVTAATLYVQALVEPLDRLIRNVDRLQVGIASTLAATGHCVRTARSRAGRRTASRQSVGRA